MCYLGDPAKRSKRQEIFHNVSDLVVVPKVEVNEMEETTLIRKST